MTALVTPPSGPTVEEVALRRLVDRLVAAHPAAAPGDVVRLARAKYDEFAGAPIRDFVPILVERHVRRLLA